MYLGWNLVLDCVCTPEVRRSPLLSPTSPPFTSVGDSGSRGPAWLSGHEDVERGRVQPGAPEAPLQPPLIPSSPFSPRSVLYLGRELTTVAGQQAQQLQAGC